MAAKGNNAARGSGNDALEMGSTAHENEMNDLAHMMVGSVFFKFIGQFLQRGLGVAFYFIVLRMLPEAEAGYYLVATALLTTILTFASFGVTASIGRFIPLYSAQGKLDRLGKLVGSLFALNIAAGLVCAAILLLFPNEISQYYGKPIGIYLPEVAALLLLSLLAQFGFTSLDGLKRFNLSTAAQTVLQGVKLAITVAALYAFGRSAHIVLFAFISSLAIICVPIAWWLFRWGKRIREHLGLSAHEALVALKFGVPASISGFADSLATYMDTLMIGFFMPIETVAAYSAAVVPIRYIAPFVFGPISSVQQPVLSDHFARGSKMFRHIVQEVSRVTMTLGIPVVALCLAFSEQIMQLLFPRYQSVSYLFWMFAPMAVATLLSNSSRNALFAHGHSRLLMVVSACILVPNVILNFFLIQSMGINGAAIATTVSVIFGETVAVFLAWKKTGATIHPEAWKPFVGGAVALAAGMMLTGAWGIMPDYAASNVLSLALSGIVLGLVYSIVMILIGGIKPDDLHSVQKIMLGVFAGYAKRLKKQG